LVFLTENKVVIIAIKSAPLKKIGKLLSVNIFKLTALVFVKKL
jgi:hypothetical protein